MSDFHIGQQCSHPEHGNGTITFVGNDYVGVELDSGQNVLLGKAAFFEAHSEEIMIAPVRTETWPESTFSFEKSEEAHSLGAHWRPFFDDATVVLKSIPAIIEKAELWIGDIKEEAPHKQPDNWTSGAVLAWPNHRQGLMAVISTGEQNQLRSLYPFITDGGQHRLTIDRVNVWEGGVEAQIDVDLGGAPITFFDIAFVRNRLWYEAGRSYDFILAGVANEAKPSELMEMSFNPNPDLIAWERQLAMELGEFLPESPPTLSLRGLAMLMPVERLDKDEYDFRGTIKSVKPTDIDVLGQQGWFVRVTVLRLEDQDVDLDILITGRAWKGDLPPTQGQDIEGCLWLQGYLWSV